MFIGLAIFIVLIVGLEYYEEKPLPNPYVNHQYGFTITYPDGWHGRENYYMGTISGKDNFTAAVVFFGDKGNMEITKWPLNNQTFDEFVASKVASERAGVPSKYNFVINGPNHTQVNGHPAYVGTSNFIGSRGNTTNYAYYIADGSSAFDITLVCLDVNCPSVLTDFGDSVNSIQFDQSSAYPNKDNQSVQSALTSPTTTTLPNSNQPLQQIRDVQVSLADHTVIQQDSYNAKVMIIFRIYNPNQVPISLTGMEYRLIINSLPVVFGNTGQLQNATIGPGESITLTDTPIVTLNSYNEAAYNTLLNDTPVSNISVNGYCSFSANQQNGIVANTMQTWFNLNF